MLVVACATLQNLCSDGAWASRVVAAGLEARLQKLVAHSDVRVVRYASGALKNLTIASQAVGGAGPQLSGACFAMLAPSSSLYARVLCLRPPRVLCLRPPCAWVAGWRGLRTARMRGERSALHPLGGRGLLAAGPRRC